MHRRFSPVSTDLPKLLRQIRNGAANVDVIRNSRCRFLLVSSSSRVEVLTSGFPTTGDLVVPRIDPVTGAPEFFSLLSGRMATPDSGVNYCSPLPWSPGGGKTPSGRDVSLFIRDRAATSSSRCTGDAARNRRKMSTGLGAGETRGSLVGVDSTAVKVRTNGCVVCTDKPGLTIVVSS